MINDKLIEQLLDEQFSVSGDKGKGGGGSSSGASEDPNTLRSRALIRVIDAISEGEIGGLVDGAKSIFFNGTPLQNADGSYNFNNVNWLSAVGLPLQMAPPGFSAIESILTMDVEVTTTNPCIQSISTSDVDAVRVTVMLPQGLSNQDTTTGDLHGDSVTMRIDTKMTSDSYWATAAGPFTISGKAMSAYEESWRVERPNTAGLWDVRIVRLSADNTSAAIKNETRVSVITEIKDIKVGYDYTAYNAYAVDAEVFGNEVPKRSSLVNGIICKIPSNYNPVTKTYSGIWDSTFITGVTSNPAWVLYDLLSNVRYGLGEFLPESMIDRYSFYDAAVYCDQLVPDGKGGQEPRFTFNYQIGAREDALKVLNAVASTMRSTVIYIGGLVRINQDRPSAAKKIVTKANVIDGKFSYRSSGLQERHTVCRATYNDKNDNFVLKSATFEDTASMDRYGYNPIEVAAYGATTEGQALRHAKWLVDTELNQKELISYKSSFKQFDLEVGDVIKVLDEDWAMQTAAGKVVEASNLRITLDRDVNITTSASLELSLADGSIESQTILDGPGTYRTLNVANPFSETPLPGADFIVASVVQPRLFRILNLKIAGTNIIEVNGVEYDPNKYNRVELGLSIPAPIFANLTAPTISPVSNITGASHGYVDAVGGKKSRIVWSWDAPIETYRIGYKIRYRKDNSNWSPEITLTHTDFILEEALAGTYEIFVTSVAISGALSTPTYFTYTHGYEGTSAGLLPPSNVAISVGHGSGANWLGEDLFVTITPNDGNSEIIGNTIGGYELQFFNGSTYLSSVIGERGQTNYTYSIIDNIRDGGPFRNIRVEAFTLDAFNRKSSTSKSGTFSNLPPAIVDNVIVTGVLNGFQVTYKKPTESDYAGILIWASKTSNFTLSTTTLVFDGDSSIITISKPSSETWYFKVAAYDTFGKSFDGTGLNVSGYITGTSLATGIPQVAVLPVTAVENDVVYLTTDKKLYHYTSGAWVAVVGDLLVNSVTAAHLDTVNAVITGTAQIGASVIGSANIQDASITNAKIHDVAADKISTGTLAASSQITVGSSIVIDGSGKITSDGPTTRTEMTNGNVVSYRKIGASLYPYQTLSHVETGLATNATSVTIPGYFLTQPRVQVSPANLQFYNATYANQSQSVNCTAGAVTESATGSMIWSFVPTATLNLSAASSNVSVNAGSGDISAASWTSVTYVLPANCTTITPTVQLRSSRGNGSSQYFYRSMRWRVEYYNGAWITTDAFRTLSMGAQTGASVTDSKTFTFPSAGAWSWRIYCEEYDTDGSVFGAVAYTYSNTTVAGSMPTYTTNWLSNIGKAASPINTVLTFGAATGSGEIYQVDYTWSVTAAISSASTGTTTTAIWGNDPAGNYQSASLSKYATGSVLSKIWTGSKTSATYLTTLTGSFYEGTPSITSVNASLTMNSCSAIIYRRTIVANSTTPVNNNYVVGYGYTLSTAQILATGTLNWMAVGS